MSLLSVCFSLVPDLNIIDWVTIILIIFIIFISNVMYFTADNVALRYQTFFLKMSRQWILYLYNLCFDDFLKMVFPSQMIVMIPAAWFCDLSEQLIECFLVFWISLLTECIWWTYNASKCFIMTCLYLVSSSVQFVRGQPFPIIISENLTIKQINVSLVYRVLITEINFTQEVFSYS